MLREVISLVLIFLPCLARNCIVLRQDRTSQAALSAKATNAYRYAVESRLYHVRYGFGTGLKAARRRGNVERGG